MVSTTKDWSATAIVTLTIIQSLIIFAMLLYGKNRKTILAITGIVDFETIIIGGAICANKIIVFGSLGTASFNTSEWAFWVPKIMIWGFMVVLVAVVGLSIHIIGEEQKRHAIEFKQLWTIVLCFVLITILIGFLIGFHVITVQFMG